MHVNFYLEVDRERKIDTHKNQNTKMHTHIYHTLGPIPKHLVPCVVAAVKYEILCQINRQD